MSVNTKSVSGLCEIHPQLRIINLYLKIAKTRNNMQQLQASMQGNSISLSSGDYQLILKFPVSVKLLENYKFQPAFVDEFYIHLRMPSGVPEGKTRGSDSVEVIGFRGLSGNYQSTNKMYIPEKGKCYRIQCAECQAILFDNIHLKRVLPLPRASWSEAASDWYCHLHDGESAHQALISRPTDCLYGSSYRSLTSSLIKDGSLTRTGRDGREWSCFICQSCVGLASDDRVNLWCHTAQWSVQEGQVWKTVSSVVSPLEAFYFTLYDALEEEKSFFGRKMSFNNPSSDTSLILWFLGDNGFTLESSCQEINNTVEFLPSRLQRVLFKSEIVNGSSNPTPKKLSDVSEYEVSMSMLHSITNSLLQSSEHLPPSSRTAAGFSIGYLPLSSAD